MSKEVLYKLDQFMYELKELKGPLRNSLYKNLNTWIQENNLDGDPHDFVDTREPLNKTLINKI